MSNGIQHLDLSVFEWLILAVNFTQRKKFFFQGENVGLAKVFLESGVEINDHIKKYFMVSW